MGSAPLSPRGQLPAASAAFLPGWAGAGGGERAGAFLAEMGREGSLCQLLQFLDQGPQALLRTLRVSLCWRACGAGPATTDLPGWELSALQIRPLWSSAELLASREQCHSGSEPLGSSGSTSVSMTLGGAQ